MIGGKGDVASSRRSRLGDCRLEVFLWLDASLAFFFYDMGNDLPEFLCGCVISITNFPEMPYR